MKMVLKIIKKGYNSYYNYTEYYLHNALQHFGYNLTRNERTADFSVTAYINNTAEYFLLTSPFFDQLHGAEQEKFCEVVASAMKSTVQLCPLSEEVELPNAAVYHFFYSSTSNAYNEPALIESGDSKLENEGYYRELGDNGKFGITIVNYGGPTTGLDIILQFPLCVAPFLSLESAQIRRYSKFGYESQEIEFKKIGNRFIAKLDHFEILSGLNKMSALWCRTITKYKHTKFYIDFKLKNSCHLPIKLLITVTPFSGTGFAKKWDLSKIDYILGNTKT